jgi:hypothetical protein
VLACCSLSGSRGLDEVHEGVVKEHCVACGTINDAVEDVGYDFALENIISHRDLKEWVIWDVRLTTRLLLLRNASRAKEA